MSNVFRFSLQTISHYQIPHTIDKWLNSLKLEEFRLLHLVYGECERKSRTEVELSTEEICQKTGIHRTNVAKTRNALVDYGLITVREDRRTYTYLIPDPNSGFPVPDKENIGTVSLESLSRETIEKYAKEILTNVFDTKLGIQARCPFHKDGTASLSLFTDKGVWKCRGCSETGNLYSLAKRLDGHPTMEKAVFAVNKRLRLIDASFRKLQTSRISPDIDYVFRDESSDELFRERRRYGLKQNTVLGRLDKDGVFRKGIDGIRNVLLNLDHICKADTVLLTEGCKDAVRIDSLRLEDSNGKQIAVTTNRSGAGAFTEEHADSLSGKRVIVCGDNDEPGITHVQDVVSKLGSRGIETRVIALPNGYKDPGDFLDRNQLWKFIQLDGMEWLGEVEIPVQI